MPDSQLSNSATLTTGNGGLQKIVIAHPTAAGEMYLHGGHVTHWQPTGLQPVFYVSPLSKYAADKSIRGGIPICLPWFGALAGRPDAPAHGFVRTAEWSLVNVEENDEGVTVRLRLKTAIDTSPFYDNEFTVDLAVNFGQTFSMAMNVINSGDVCMAFDEALHTYYRVGDARQVSVTGLRGVSYLDKPAGAAARLESAPAITFNGEVDRIYIDTGETCVINDPVMSRAITVEKFLSRSTVVWNPAVKRATELADIGPENWPNFVCVETANIADDGIKLVPSGSHEIVLNVSVDAI